jgi:hypothetical protein
MWRGDVRSYRMRIYEAREGLRQTYEIHALDDAEAATKAEHKYNEVAQENELAQGLKFERFVLYDGNRVVCEKREGIG